MYKNKEIAVVIPAYNEENLIGRVIETIPKFVDKIIVVDDASFDKTHIIIQEHQNSYKKVILITHKVNQGVGGAIASGYKWCRDHDIDIAVVMAGDAQMNPDNLPSLIEPVINNKADYSKGNRLFTGEAWENIPRIRYLGNSMLSLLTKVASGYWQVADSQCGYTAANKKVLQTIKWDKMYKKYGQPNDLLVRLNIEGFVVVDIPVEPIYNIGEKSGIKPIRMIPRLLLLITRLFFYRMIQKYIIRDFHPLILFYVSGLFLSLVNFFFVIRLISKWMLEGIVPEITLLAVVFCTFVSILFILFAMLFDMEYSKYIQNR